MSKGPNVHAIAQTIGQFFDADATLIKSPLGQESVFLVGLVPWTDDTGKVPALALRMEVAYILGQNNQRQPFPVDTAISQFFQLTTITANGDTLFVGQGDFGYSIHLREDSTAQLLQFHVEEEVYDRHYEASTNAEDNVLAQQLAEAFFRASSDAIERF